MNVQVQAAPVSVAAPELAEFVARLFAATGLPTEAAAVVAAGLVEADLEGLPSHGVMLADIYIERLQKGSVSKAVQAAVVSERQGAVVLDAGNALRHQRARANEIFGVPFGVDVVGDGGDLVALAQPLAQRVHQCGLARADRAADPHP